jgi:hypothetical protein
MGKTTVTAAIANEPIHCPTKWYRLKKLTDMNKIPIERGNLFDQEFFNVLST